MNRNVLSGRRGVAAGIVVVAVAFVLGYLVRGGGAPPSGAPAETAATIWTCSMHPDIRLPEPGQCPICAMDLIPLDAEDGGDGAIPSITLSPRARALARVETAPVRRSVVEKTIRLVGRLEAEEARERTVAARVPGRIERLHVDVTGVRVDRGQPLFDLYSPELYSAQEELLQALATARASGSAGSGARTAQATVEAARERLRLWGLDADQIAEVERRGNASPTITVRSPIAGVVTAKDAVEGMYVETGTRVYRVADLETLRLELDAYESDLPWLAVDQPVAFTTDAAPGEQFTGHVAFIDPLVDPRTRTASLRVAVDNPEGRLRPGLFARAEVTARLERVDGEEPLVIPASAPLLTGTRAIVYVADPATEGRYTGREVVLGPKADDAYVVAAGLEAGERVVVNGAFRIDSALQIQAHPSMMSPDSPPEATPATRVASVAGVPAAFAARVDDLLTGYYALTHALSEDDPAAAREAAGALADLVRTTNADVLSGEMREGWRELGATLGEALATIGGTANIEAQRRAFDTVSDATIRTIREFGTSGRQAAVVFFCPMAFDNRGAEWLQRSGPTANPYFGAAMYPCGAAGDTLVSPDAAGGVTAPAAHGGGHVH